MPFLDYCYMNSSIHIVPNDIYEQIIIISLSNFGRIQMEHRFNKKALVVSHKVYTDDLIFFCQLITDRAMLLYREIHNTPAYHSYPDRLSKF